MLPLFPSRYRNALYIVALLVVSLWVSHALREAGITGVPRFALCFLFGFVSGTAVIRFEQWGRK